MTEEWNEKNGTIRISIPIPGVHSVTIGVRERERWKNDKCEVRET